MADTTLKTDYKDDVLDTSKNTQRKYQMIQNEDGTVSFVDVTEYSQTGDSFGAKDVNEIAEAFNDLNSNMQECFQSVSNGKAKMASAITGKGVTTPSDATFDVMASNVNKITGGKCISLGNGTSFDVKTVCANNGIDYTKLTVNNFIVGVSKMPSMNTSSDNNKLSDSGWGYICATGFTVSKNYSNGVLTISNIAQTLYVQDSLGSGQRQNKTQTATCFAYLVYTG